MEQYWKSIYRYEEPVKKSNKLANVPIGGATSPGLVQPQTNITFDTNKIDWNLDDALAKAMSSEPIVISSKIGKTIKTPYPL